jgi:hypothetical protein
MIGGYDDYMGQLDPAQVIPGGLVTPTPDNPLGIPGLGGTLVVPTLPGVPATPAQPIPGGGTDPNNPKVGPLPGAQPAQAAPSLTSSPVVLLAAGAVLGVIVAKVFL